MISLKFHEFYEIHFIEISLNFMKFEKICEICTYVLDRTTIGTNISYRAENTKKLIIEFHIHVGVM